MIEVTNTKELRTQLKLAIEDYVQASIADYNKGGGDPASYAEIEQNLEQSGRTLNGLINIVRLRDKG